MTVSKFTDLPPTPLTPVGAARMAKSGAIAAAVAMVKVLSHTLKQHSDPMVKQAMAEIEELCIHPWMREQVEKAENVGFQISEEIDFYDLVLPTGRQQFSIGSSSSAQTCLPENAACTFHVSVHAEEKNGDLFWTAEIKEPRSGDNFRTAKMTVGDETVEAERRSGSFSSHTSSGEGRRLIIKPGDVIEIGTSHIRLHAPEPEAASDEASNE